MNSLISGRDKTARQPTARDGVRDETARQPTGRQTNRSGEKPPAIIDLEFDVQPGSQFLQQPDVHSILIGNIHEPGPHQKSEVSMFRSPSSKWSLVRVESSRNDRQSTKMTRSITIALSDMEQLVKSSRSARCSSRPARAPGCDCSCHLLNDVIIAPRQAVFTRQGGISTHTLSNASKTPLAVKITCSDNVMYRVNPVFALLEPGRCISLHIGRLEGESKRDRLCILLLEHDGVGPAKEAFKRNNVRPASICVPLTVTDEE